MRWFRREPRAAAPEAPAPPAVPPAPESLLARRDRHTAELARLCDRLRPDWTPTFVRDVVDAVTVDGVRVAVTATVSLERRDDRHPPRYRTWMRYLERHDDDSWAVRTEHDVEARFPAGAEDEVHEHLRSLRPPFRRHVL